jgi:hypothetical protein
MNGEKATKNKQTLDMKIEISSKTDAFTGAYRLGIMTDKKEYTIVDFIKEYGDISLYELIEKYNA